MIAMTTEESEAEFEAAVEMLAVMDATEELRSLRNHPGMSAGLVERLYHFR